MNQRQYHTIRTRQREKNVEEYLPYSVVFRIRLILSVFLFLFFAFAERNILTEAEKQIVYKAMEQTVTPKDWKNYAISTFSTLEELENK